MQKIGWWGMWWLIVAKDCVHFLYTLRFLFIIFCLLILLCSTGINHDQQY